MKLLIRLSIFLFVGVAFFAIATNVWVISSTKNRVYSKLEEVPTRQTALVLGTSKRFSNGEPNTYFYNRMDAAAALYKKGKVKRFILSGDNTNRYYNEPKDMKTALVERGVPEELIVLDNGGYRTLESVIRCKEIFGQRNIVVVTQDFHSYRALFICHYFDLNAVAYTAEDVSVYKSSEVNLREFFARPKAVLDLYVLKNMPKAISGAIPESL